MRTVSEQSSRRQRPSLDRDRHRAPLTRRTEVLRLVTVKYENALQTATWQEALLAAESGDRSWPSWNCANRSIPRPITPGRDGTTLRATESRAMA